MNVFLFRYLLVILCGLTIAGCNSSSSASNSGGSGSEIVGIVEQPSSHTTHKASTFFNVFGLPAIGAYIYIYPDTLDPVIGQQPVDYVPAAKTDSSGKFSIANVMPGTWILEASDGTHSVAERVEVNRSGDQIDVGTLILETTGQLKITVNTGISSALDLHYYVFIQGTRIYGEGDNDKLTLHLNDIPSGTDFSVKIQMTEPLPWSYTFTDIKLNPGELDSLTVQLP